MSAGSLKWWPAETGSAVAEDRPGRQKVMTWRPKMTCQCRKHVERKAKQTWSLETRDSNVLMGWKSMVWRKSLVQRVAFSCGGVTTTFGIELVDLAPVMTFISVSSALQPKPTTSGTHIAVIWYNMPPICTVHGFCYIIYLIQISISVSITDQNWQLCDFLAVSGTFWRDGQSETVYQLVYQLV